MTSGSPAESGGRTVRALAIVLAAGVLLRLAILATTGDLSLRIADESHYHTLATSLVEGRGFAFESGPTSLRPPLYPAFIAAIWTIAGSHSLQVVRLAQILLSVATAWLVFWTARRLYDERAGVYAAALTMFYPPLVASGFFLLTETLFTFLLVSVAALTVALVQCPAWWRAAALGACVALAALTRSVLWPFPLVLAAALLWLLPGRGRARLGAAAVVVIAAAVVLTPWAVRNTRLQKVPVVVDTMGGMNLRMGNYEHTPNDRIWDAVSMTGDRSWIVGLPTPPPGHGPWSEGEKERWARDRAVAFMLEHPGLTFWRAIVKFTDFWALDRDFVAGLQQGLFRPPAWFAILAAVAMLLAYPLIMVLAVGGVFRRPPREWRAHVLLLLLVFFVCGLHTIVFGHPRYRLPLMPVLGIYAAAAIGAGAWRQVSLRTAWAPALVVVLLAGVWTAQFVVRDWSYAERLLTLGPQS
jgi:4-amino-4-deoxy-L-arabinose transferase-like glycosyltransferase